MLTSLASAKETQGSCQHSSQQSHDSVQSSMELALQSLRNWSVSPSLHHPCIPVIQVSVSACGSEMAASDAVASNRQTTRPWQEWNCDRYTPTTGTLQPPVHGMRHSHDRECIQDTTVLCSRQWLQAMFKCLSFTPLFHAEPARTGATARPLWTLWTHWPSPGSSVAGSARQNENCCLRAWPS